MNTTPENVTDEHVHKLEPQTVNVRLYRHEKIEGVPTESLSGIDKVKVWRCKCGYERSADIIERKIA